MRNGIWYPKPSFLVSPQGLCFKRVGNETCQDLTLRTITLLVLYKKVCWGGTKNEGLR
jgi:hypothetical protein